MKVGPLVQSITIESLMTVVEAAIGGYTSWMP